MAWINDDEVLNLEGVRIKLRDNLRNFGLVVSDDASIYEIADLYVNTLSVDADINYLKTGKTRKIDDATIINIVNQIPASISKLKADNLLTLQNNTISSSNITNLWLPKLTSMYGLVVVNCKIKNFIAPSLTYCSSTQPLHSISTLLRVITPKLSGFTYYYNLGACILIDTLNGLPDSLVSLKTIILRSSSLVALSSVRFSNLEEVYVPESLLNNYKTASNWSTYEDKIHKIEGSKYENENWYENEEWYQEEELSAWQ